MKDKLKTRKYLKINERDQKNIKNQRKIIKNYEKFKNEKLIKKQTKNI